MKKTLLLVLSLLGAFVACGAPSYGSITSRVPNSDPNISWIFTSIAIVIVVVLLLAFNSNLRSYFQKNGTPGVGFELVSLLFLVKASKDTISDLRGLATLDSADSSAREGISMILKNTVQREDVVCAWSVPGPGSSKDELLSAVANRFCRMWKRRLSEITSSLATPEDSPTDFFLIGIVADIERIPQLEPTLEIDGAWTNFQAVVNQPQTRHTSLIAFVSPGATGLTAESGRDAFDAAYKTAEDFIGRQAAVI